MQYILVAIRISFLVSTLCLTDILRTDYDFSIMADSYQNLSIDELRQLCESRGIEYNHPKDSCKTLVSRLNTFDKSLEQDETTATMSKDKTIQDGTRLDTLASASATPETTDSMTGLTFEERVELMKIKFELERVAREAQMKHEIKLAEMKFREKEQQRRREEEYQRKKVILIKIRDMTSEEDVEEYFEIFEKTMLSLDVPKEHWVANLAPRLNEKCRFTYLELSEAESRDYQSVKDNLLEIYHLTVDHYRYRFKQSQKQAGEDFITWAKRTRKYLDSWMKKAEASGNVDRILEQVTLDKMYDSVSVDLKAWLKEKKPKTAVEWGRLANEYVQARKGPLIDGKYVGVRGKGKTPERKETEQAPSTEAKTVKDKDMTKVRCYNCSSFGHYASQCELPRRKKTETAPGYLCLAPLEGYHEYSPLYFDGKISGKKAQMVVDSGCTRTLVNKKFAPENSFTGHLITVLTASGNEVTAPLAKVEIVSRNGRNEEVVGVLNDLPVDCLLGKSSYSKTLSRKDILEQWEHDSNRENCEAQQAMVVTRQQAKLRAAQEREDKLIDRENSLAQDNLEPKPVRQKTAIQQIECNSDLFDSNSMLELSDEEIKQQERYANDRCQTEDEASKRLKPEQFDSENKEFKESVSQQRNVLDRNTTQLIKDQNADVNLHSLNAEDTPPLECDGYYRQKGVLMHRRFKKEEHNGVKYYDRVVLPQAYRLEILRIAHSIPLAGHLGQEKTRERIEPHFFWPGCYKEINNYCATCPECQLVTRKMKALRAPLKSVPIVDTPFRKVAMDLIGELPRSKAGYRFVLTLVDYATRYPEAVPLKNASAKEVANALISIFSRVGIPEELVSDQGANLIGKLMTQLYETLGIHKINVSVYHPEANGLVERFNGTLKSMLKKFITDNVKDWDKYIPYLLFAYREVPTSSLGYSPFELLYGRTVRGPLTVIKESWLERDPGETDLVSHMIEIRRRFSQMSEVVKENLKESQEKQKRLYNKQSSHRLFQIGDKVIVFLPTASTKLESKWSGPYEVITVKDDGRSYEVDTKQRRKRYRTFNVNLLKRWQTRNEVAALAVHRSKIDILPQGKLPETTCCETWEDVEISPRLTASEVDQVKALLREFGDVFTGVPNRTTAEVFHIDTGDAKPIRCTPYRVPQALQAQYDAEIENMLKMDIIQPSKSAWAAPTVIVPKPDGTIRFCADYRRLNEVIKMDAYPLPRMEGMIEKVARAKYISTLDLTKGYWQIPIDEASREKSAFITPKGLYEFKVMPFGIKTAPAVFQRMMSNRVLNEMQQPADSYIDDVEIDSETFDQHLGGLREVLLRLRKFKLSARPSKCKIAMQTVSFLGHLVGNDQIKPKQALVESLLRFPRPERKKQVRQFIGLASYYRKFIPNFSTRALALTDLTKGGKNEQITWTDECEKSFQDLKSALTNPPVLTPPCFTNQFILQVDASNRGLGAILCQRDPSGDEHPVCYGSRKLLPREELYSTTEKECLGIIWAVELFRYYLYGRQFILETDHNPLVWLSKVKDKSQRLLRWSLTLQEFDVVIKYKKGVENRNADTLSRLY